jgi:protein ImuB
MSTAFSAKPRRYLALWLPFLPADRIGRRIVPSPSQDEAPFVFTEPVKGALRLAAVDRRAQALGLAPGLTLADARARIPALRALDMDREADAALLARIADLCDRYTPLAALDGADGLMLDITGCAHLFGGEAGLRADLLHRLDRAGIEARVSIAGTPDAACALARFAGPDIVPPGGDGEAVRPLPVAALTDEPETLRALLRAGLRTVGDVAGRPRVTLAARFGADLVVRLARTLGEEDIRITPRRPLPACMAERRFAEPLALMDDALAALADLAVQVAGMLERRGEGGRRFEAAFFHVDGKLTRLAAATGSPLRDPETLMRLFRERLEALGDRIDPGFGFDLVRLSVLASEPFAAVQPDLDGRAVEEQEVSALIDRLGARLGADAVLRFDAIDSHVPERAARSVPAISKPAAAARRPAPDWCRAEPGAPPPRPIHLFDPPQPVETLAEVPDGPPVRFRWRRVEHRVAFAEGPERIAPEWWRQSDDSLTRDYYRVEDETGRRFWLFREGLYGRDTGPPRWFLHGLFP